MTDIKLVSDAKTENPVTWKATVGGMFGIRDWKRVRYEQVLISSQKAIALTVLGFAAVAVALIVAAVALGMLFSIPVVTPLAAAAMVGIGVAATLSQASLISIVAGAGAVLLAGLVVGSAAVHTIRRSSDNSPNLFSTTWNDDSYVSDPDQT